ncbi:DUF1738 domain-containing protein [Luteolibacter pohnpeiensis]|uniref:DUF1738 domain-containing protein n=1 Tax=Luteolibacter pohnpeiensis TaxID=454153 RepID=A0A934VS09_9BACT|nr:zincin-like metallopeptidase domain-containing protein [Luteolibacter pohnpeiensis]MBK1883776.1 DUF1738 domain-containing protein [Luteolibacter pohnpeiensis]
MKKHAPTGEKSGLSAVYQRVTQRILDKLEEGVVPWHSPHTATVGFPCNFQSQNLYRGINVMLLAMAGYTSPYFLTYRQALEMGGQVRRGESGYPVIKYGSYKRQDQEDDEKPNLYLRLYTVFNACQIDGINFPEPEPQPFTPSQRVGVAKSLVEGMVNPPVIHEGRSVRTCYDPRSDEIEIPNRSYFENEERFYKSLFHELVHATGSSKRLARKSLIDNKGRLAGNRVVYSKEELVAELGTAFVCAHAGIVMDDHDHSASYIQSWLRVLQSSDNRRWLIEAAAHAQRAADYLIGYTAEGESHGPN